MEINKKQLEKLLLNQSNIHLYKLEIKKLKSIIKKQQKIIDSFKNSLNASIKIQKKRLR